MLIAFIIIFFVLIRSLAVVFGVRRRGFYGYNQPNGYPGYYGCRRHHRIGRGLVSILALVALERLFTRRF